MPPIKKPAAVLDFSAFPPPAAGSEDWQPDRDYIASPGELKDERFNRNPYQDARLRAARTEYGYNVREDTMSVRPSQTASARAAPVNHLANGQWPPQEMRSHRPDFAAPIPAQAPASANSVRAVPATAMVPPVPTTVIVQPVPQPPESISSDMMTPTVKAPDSKPLPLWASSLGQMLSETPPSTSPPAKATPKSLPPHLRKTAAQSTISGTLEVSCRKPDVIENRISILEADYEAACEASRRVSSPTPAQMQAYQDSQSGENATTSTFQDAVKTSRMTAIDKLLEDLGQSTDVATQHPCVNDYGHHLKVTMLFNMVKDLLEPELLKLSGNELESRILRVSSLSEHAWQQVHGKSVTPNTTPNGHQGNGVHNGHRYDSIYTIPQANGVTKDHHVVDGSRR